MDWTSADNMGFLLGTLLATGFIAYGGWLLSTTPAADFHQAPAGGPRKDANSGAKPFLALLRDAVRRERLASTLVACYAAGSIIGILAPAGFALAIEPFGRGVGSLDNFNQQATITEFRRAAENAAARARAILGFV